MGSGSSSVADVSAVDVPVKTPPPPLPEKPKLRDGCSFVLHEFRSGQSWVLENLATGKFFRIGAREERLARMLDGKKSLLEILGLVAEWDDPFSPEEVLIFLQNLRVSGLLDGEEAAVAPAKGFWNPMFLKWRLGNPDALLDGLESRFRFFPSSWLVPLFFCVGGAGAYAVASDFSRFGVALGSVFSSGNVWSLFVCFFLLKILHEAAHGVVCKRFGGHIPEVGLLLVFFVPLTYIDATSSWRFPSKVARMLVSSAGMLAELFVAAVAALVWANTETGAVNTIAANVGVAASVTTLFFNANPLMRFDGYFLLSDWLGQPNLYAKAARASSAWLGWLFFGVGVRPVSGVRLAFYGAACLVWRTLLVFGLCIAAVAYLSGFGMVLAGLTLAATYLPGLAKIPARFRAWREKGKRVSVGRIGVWCGVLVGVFWFPVVAPPVLPGWIEPAERTVLRVQCPGFVREVRAEAGAEVRQGEMIFFLENQEEAMRARKLESDADRAEARALQAAEQKELAKMGQQIRQAEALREQAKEAHAYLATLSVCAPKDGALYGRNFGQMEGLFLPSGYELATMGARMAREVRILLPQRDFDRLRPRVGDPVRVWVGGRGRVFTGSLSAVESAATREIRFPGVTALGGGSVGVMKDLARGEDGDFRSKSSESGLSLIEPHFYLTAALSEEGGNAEIPSPGETVLVAFPDAKRVSLWRVFVAWCERFVEQAEQGGEEKMR